MKKIKNILKSIFLIVIYIIFRIANTPFWWRGTPSLLAWLEDVERAKKHVQAITSASAIVLITYFFGWIIMTILVAVTAVIQWILYTFTKKITE